jgi:hypothetical protein
LLDRLPQMDSPCVLLAGETLASASSPQPQFSRTQDFLYREASCRLRDPWLRE